MAQKSRSLGTLEYVRKERNLSRASVAKEINTSDSKLAKFEQGEAQPSLRQFALLERIYGVPSYLLAGESRPNLEPLLLDYRKDVAAPSENSPKGLAAYFSRLEAAETFSGLATAAKIDSLYEVPIVAQAKDLVTNVEKILKLINFDPTDFDNIKNPDVALRKLRYGVEGFNLFCFLVQVPQIDYRGLFSHVSDAWGMSLVNKRTFKDKARMFTVGHELGHFILDKPGISDPLLTENALELACNRFSSQILAPSDYFRQLTSEAKNRSKSTDGIIRYISERCLLSMGATAYRLREEDEISRKSYNDWYAFSNMPTNYGAEDTEDDLQSDDSSGGSWAYNVISDWGYRPIEIVKKSLSEGIIDRIDAERLLNARGDTLDKVFDTVEKRLQEISPDER